MKNSLAVVYLTFNRHAYLKESLESLLLQSTEVPFELVIFDNGSDVPVSLTMASVLQKFKNPVTLHRSEINILSSKQLGKAVDLVTSDFVLLPGDDDILTEEYVETMYGLANSSPTATMISTAMETIDASGQPLGEMWWPPEFKTQSQAFATLFQENSYSMPATGFLRTAVDFTKAPGSVTGIDWWIWLQCWLKGEAVVSRRSTVKYRRHFSQESQMRRGRESGWLDGARTIGSIVTSPEFIEVVSKWSQQDLSMFTKGILQGPGLNGQDPQWGPMLQMLMSDNLSEFLPDAEFLDLYSDASARCGVLPGFVEIQAATSTGHISQVPTATWLRIPIGAKWKSNCDFSNQWRTVLNIPNRNSRASMILDFDCTCSLGENSHALKVKLFKGTEPDFLGIISETPTRDSINSSLRMFEPTLFSTQVVQNPVGVEQHLLSLIRKSRQNYFFVKIERFIRRIRFLFKERKHQ